MSRKPKSRRGPGGEPPRSGRFKKGQSGNPATQWKPGQSGNPIGLPAEYAHVRDLAKAYTGNAMKALVEIANDPLHAARHQAAKAILEQGWDAEVKKLELTGAGGRPLEMKTEVTVADPDRIAGILGVLSKAGALSAAERAGAAEAANDTPPDEVRPPHPDDSSSGVPPSEST